jgi:hypothetical protein
MATSDWLDFLAVDWLTMKHISILNIPVKVPLGGGRHAELTEWNGSKRLDLRYRKTDTIPTKVGVSLSLPQWKVLYSDMQVVDDLISRHLLGVL